MIWLAERFGDLRRGKIAQTNGEDGALNRAALGGRRLLTCRLLARLVDRRRGGNGSGLQHFAGRGGEVLLRGKPVVPLGIAGKAAAEYPALHLRKFELPITERVAAAEGSFGERNLVVAPAQIAKREQSVAGKLIEGPLALAFEFEGAGAEIMAAGDGSGFGEIELRIIRAAQMRTAKIGDLATGREMRAAGIPAQRGNRGGVRSQAKFEHGHPGKGAVIE